MGRSSGTGRLMFLIDWEELRIPVWIPWHRYKGVSINERRRPRTLWRMRNGGGLLDIALDGQRGGGVDRAGLTGIGMDWKWFSSQLLLSLRRRTRRGKRKNDSIFRSRGRSGRTASRRPGRHWNRGVSKNSHRSTVTHTGPHGGDRMARANRLKPKGERIILGGEL